MIINGVAISDIHFGGLPAKQLYNELRKEFLIPIHKMENLDLVIINGDLTDKKISLNDEHGRYLIKFIDDLVKICMGKGAKLRIVKGTRNHDLNQLNNFSYLETKKKLDFRIINTVTEEEVYPDFKVLFIPEEYMDNQKTFYEPYFKNNHSMCFGHGTMEFQAFENQVIESEKPIMNAPVFKYDDFNNVSGAVIFGHIHNRCSYKNKLFYCGSFSRWMFGEEQPKGYIGFTYDTDNEDCSVWYNDNKLAKTYITLDISDQINPELPVDKQIEEIEKIKEKTKADYIRFKITNRDDISEIDTVLLKSYFKQNSEKNTKISVTKPKTKKTKEEEELLEKYDFIFNNKLSLADTLSKYLEVHDDIILDSATIEKALFEEE